MFLYCVSTKKYRERTGNTHIRAIDILGSASLSHVTVIKPLLSDNSKEAASPLQEMCHRIGRLSEEANF